MAKRIFIGTGLLVMGLSAAACFGQNPSVAGAGPENDVREHPDTRRTVDPDDPRLSNPFSETTSPFGSQNPDNPFGDAASPFGSRNPDNPFYDHGQPYFPE